MIIYYVLVIMLLFTLTRDPGRCDLEFPHTITKLYRPFILRKFCILPDEVPDHLCNLPALFSSPPLVVPNNLPWR